ncbi:MAG TPA: DinB family protein [Candidatus Dormibacteraeota bacterium]|nr:DinB family protein [Candidatus Dormibacteraeota bacterium]
MSDAVVKALGLLFKELHEKLRGQVRGLDRGTLNWRPLPKANSVAVLVTHTIGSELEMIRSVRSIPTQRDRDSEFKAESDAERLLEMIDAADREMAQQIAALTPEDLSEPRTRADGRPPRPGIEWLISNYGHGREHLAQIELTKQLYDSRT